MFMVPLRVCARFPSVSAFGPYNTPSSDCSAYPVHLVLRARGTSFTADLHSAKLPGYNEYTQRIPRHRRIPTKIQNDYIVNEDLGYDIRYVLVDRR